MKKNRLGYCVAEVKALVNMRLSCREVRIGDIITISDLDHPTDLKLWANAQYQIPADWVDWKNPVHIIRKDG